MTLSKKKNTTKTTSASHFAWLSYFFTLWVYLCGWFTFKHSDELESSLKVIKHNKRNSLRKPLVFPVQNPNVKIKNIVSTYGNVELNSQSFKQEKQKYLQTLSKKKQEDYAYELRLYHKWLFIWPFYWLWIKFIRLFNLDFVINKDSRYEFSSEELEAYVVRQTRFETMWDKVSILHWFRSYYFYLKQKIQQKSYQKWNWIAYISSSIVFVICLSIIIAYSVYAIEGTALVPFAPTGTYPNFFMMKLAFSHAVLGVATFALVLLLVPIVILISLWLNNINDAQYNIIYVYSQQVTYVIVFIFLVCSACMELALYFAH